MAKRRKHPVHPFIFHVDNHDGRGEVEIPLVCKVIPAKQDVWLDLATEDVVKSNKLGGIGKSNLCAMAQCTKRQRNAFPHEHLGVIDWLLKTCFVLVRMPDRKHQLGLCVKYEHVDD